ncbi:MAG: hydrogenase maturation protease [Anaerolineales bacterium]|nr:hydrogenase maturation protease [Anaerolineales bacterium]
MPVDKILVVGLGNPILGDDGVGWAVAHEVETQLKDHRNDVEFDYLSLGGLSLMERFINYKHVVLIDSIRSGQHPIGSVLRFTLEDLADVSGGHMTAAHDTSLKTALVIGRNLEAALPDDKDIHIIAIEAEYVYDFQESLTPPIAAAVPAAVKQTLTLLNEIR